jgi:hypothetical protein
VPARNVWKRALGLRHAEQQGCEQYRNIGDFTRWKEHDAYSNALDRLLRDLWVEKG